MFRKYNDNDRNRNGNGNGKNLLNATTNETSVPDIEDMVISKIDKTETTKKKRGLNNDNDARKKAKTNNRENDDQVEIQRRPSLINTLSFVLEKTNLSESSTNANNINKMDNNNKESLNLLTRPKQ